MNRTAITIICLLASVSASSVAGTNPAETTQGRMTWFRDARFGMFIHWGL
ncbi:MAG: alpha-L-fucosidase, partial [Bryobacteraceae bacterium]